jgi:hypothetical protein
VLNHLRLILDGPSLIRDAPAQLTKPSRSSWQSVSHIDGQRKAARVRLRLSLRRCLTLWSASPGTFTEPIGNPLDEARFFVEPGDRQGRVAFGVLGREGGPVLDEQGQRLGAGRDPRWPPLMKGGKSDGPVLRSAA